MKIQLANEKASRLINSGQVILVSSAYEGKANITTCAWHMPVSRKPALLGIALARTHLSSELINKSKEFIINIPQWVLLDKAMLCGSVSGRKVDKFKAAGFTPQKASVLKGAIKIKECIADIECKLYDIKEAGDHFIFLGEAVYAQVEEKYFINDFWNTDKVELIFHLGSRFFFKSAPYFEFKPKEAKT